MSPEMQSRGALEAAMSRQSWAFVSVIAEEASEKINGPTASRALAALKYTDNVKGLFLRQSIYRNGSCRPGADDRNPFNRSHDMN